MRLENMENHHSQPGNPDKAGEVITRLVNYEKMPGAAAAAFFSSGQKFIPQHIHKKV